MRDRRWWLPGLAILALMVIVLVPLASPEPDGLERVAHDAGFMDQARETSYDLLPGYTIPGLDDAVLSTILAGLLGVLLVFMVTWLLGHGLKRRRRDRDSMPSRAHEP